MWILERCREKAKKIYMRALRKAWPAAWNKPVSCAFLDRLCRDFLFFDSRKNRKFCVNWINREGTVKLLGIEFFDTAEAA